MGALGASRTWKPATSDSEHLQSHVTNGKRRETTQTTHLNQKDLLARPSFLKRDSARRPAWPEANQSTWPVKRLKRGCGGLCFRRSSAGRGGCDVIPLLVQGGGRGWLISVGSRTGGRTIPRPPPPHPLLRRGGELFSWERGRDRGVLWSCVLQVRQSPD